ncbi:MAG: cystathionine beta-synthase [Candidatus Aquicultorales bacterium]
MGYKDSVLNAIGRTPLIKLNRIGDGTKATFIVKYEAVNPGGSIKDRIGLAMVEAAEKEGTLKPGGTIVEATAGNTGVGLALAAAVKGYRCIYVMPDKMSEDKVNLLKAYGAEVVVTPTAVPPDSPESYNGVANRIADEIPGAWRPDQFANESNPAAHYRTTGPEIFTEIGEDLDVFVAGVGTGGSISGIGRYLKERKPGVRVVAADPAGSILSGDSPKPWKVEGIGEDFIPATFDRQVVDEFIRVTDAESFSTARRLAREEGLLVGGSSGTAMAAALKYAQRLTSPATIVVLLPDTGRNYINGFYSDKWMEKNGFETQEQPSVTLGDILRAKSFPNLISIAPSAQAIEALKSLRRHEISQIPVIEGDRVLGTIHEMTLMKLLHDGADLAEQKVADIMGRPLPVVDENAESGEAYRLLLSGNSGIVILAGGHPAGVVTQMDLVELWSGAKFKTARGA